MSHHLLPASVPAVMPRPSSRPVGRWWTALVVMAALVSGCAVETARVERGATVHAPKADWHCLPGDLSDAELRSLFPPPPVKGSPADQLELELVRAIQQSATPESIARAKAEDKMTPAIFADVLGKDFTPERFPKTFAILNQAAKESKVLSDRAKDLWGRPRPAKVDERITVHLNDKPDSYAYPSGHSTRARLWMRLLVALKPDSATALSDRARLVGYDRIVAGVHFPTDVIGGTVLGDALAERILANQAMKAELEAARAELARP